MKQPGAVVCTLLVLTSCTSSAPTHTPSATVALEVVPTPSCPDAAPPISGQPPVDRAGLQVPGRALFVDGGVMRVHEAGRIREVAAPFTTREPYARIASDGRVVALLGGPGPGDSTLWSEPRSGETAPSVRIPTPFSGEAASLLWSPSLQRLAYYDWGKSDAWRIGLDAAIEHVSFADRVYAAAWRDDEEITLVTSAKQPWPIADATLWSWKPPAAPVKIAGPLTLAGAPRWSPDGKTMATIETRTDGRAVVLRSASDRTLITEHDLGVGPNSCIRSGVEFTGLTWSPDGRMLAVLGKGISYFVAFADVIGGRSPSVFAAPINALSCYIPPAVDWSGTQAVVPVHGPNCGSGATGAENAIALFDPSAGRLDRYALIARKGYLVMSGRWAAAVSSDGKGTTFISLDDPAIRTTVPLRHLVHFCCTP